VTLLAGPSTVKLSHVRNNVDRQTIHRNQSWRPCRAGSSQHEDKGWLMTAPADTPASTLCEISTCAGVLRYYDIGDGLALLLLHGSGPGAPAGAIFAASCPRSPNTSACLILEFPGFGVSDDFGDHPMLTAEDATVSFVDALELDRVDIVEATRWAPASESLSLFSIPSKCGSWSPSVASARICSVQSVHSSKKAASIRPVPAIRGGRHPQGARAGNPR
jgi:hypothetical protein